MKQQRFMDYVSERLRQARYTADKAQEAYLQAAGQIAALEELLQRSIDGSIAFPGQENQVLKKEEEGDNNG